MLIKILGNILVIVSSAAVGLYYAFRDGFREEDLFQIKRALGILRSEVEYARAPLPEAFYNISQRIDKPFSNIFADISEKLSEKGNPGVSSVWTDSFVRHRTSTHLAAEDLESLYSFGKTLGYLDRSMQLNSISMLENYIDTKMDYLKEVSSKNKKMYGSLGFLCGILVCVILL